MRYNDIGSGCIKTNFNAALYTGTDITHRISRATGAEAVLQQWDADHDGTLDLAEAKKAAAAKFDALDRDHDGTLDAKELRGILSAKDIRDADPDNDKTIDKNEYTALVEKRFKAADKDNDGTLDKKELNSSAGKALMRLLQ